MKKRRYFQRFRAPFLGVLGGFQDKNENNIGVALKTCNWLLNTESGMENDEKA